MVNQNERTPYPVEGELPCLLAFLACSTLASRVQDDLLVIEPIRILDPGRYLRSVLRHLSRLRRQF